MNSLNSVARILLIADDRAAGERYRNALTSGGYSVIQADSFVETLGTTMLEPDMDRPLRPRRVFISVANGAGAQGSGGDDAGYARRRSSSPRRAARRTARNHVVGRLALAQLSEGRTQHDALLGDLEGSHLRVVTAGARLEDGQRAFDAGIASDVLEEQNVVRQMGHPLLGDPDDVEKVRHLEGRKEAHPETDQSLRQ